MPFAMPSTAAPSLGAMPEIAATAASVPESLIRRVHELALGLGRDYIALHIGEPRTPVAPHIIAAASAAWGRDDTDYAPNGGIRPLREAAAAWLGGFGRPIAPEQVWVTNGATQALHQAIGLAAGPGEEVLVPDPGYTTFTMSTRYHGAVPVPYALRPETGFGWEVDRLDALVTPRTRAIIVNSPSNPLGTVLDESGARELLDWARRRDLWVISDEVYERFTWGGPHVSLTGLDTDDRVLGAFSTSKTYAMTGIRIGLLVTPPGWSSTMGALQEAVVSCIDVPGQWAAVAAIGGDQEHVANARTRYREHLAAARAVLAEKGYASLAPGGAFYLWVDVREAARDGDDVAWCDRMLLEHGVAIAPGSAFGSQGRGWVRVCCAGDREALLEGLGRLPAV